MRKVGVLVFLMLSLSIITSLFATPANCRVKAVTVTFRGRASGDCLLIRGMPVPGPFPSPVEWLGSAKGTAGISGLAEAVLFQIGTPYGNTYDSEDLEASGSVSLTWTEGENTHMLIVQLRSTRYTRGVFAPDADYFTLPVGGDPPSKALSFKGIHISNQRMHKIEGFGLFGFMTISSFVPLWGDIPSAVMLLFDEVEQKKYSMVWLSQEAEIPLGPGGPMITVPAARVLQSTVSIIGRP